METLFQDFVRENYPQYSKKMDYYNYERNRDSAEIRHIIWTLLNMVSLKLTKGKDIDIKDLKQLTSNQLLDVVFTDETDSLVYDEDDMIIFENGENYKKIALSTLLQQYFIPIIDDEEYQKNKRVLLSDKQDLVINKIDVRDWIEYPIGSLLVPTIRKKLNESNQSERQKLIADYLAFFENNHPDEAIHVFGIDIESEQGISEIHKNYFEFLKELSDRLGAEIEIRDLEDGENYEDTEEKQQER